MSHPPDTVEHMFDTVERTTHTSHTAERTVDSLEHELVALEGLIGQARARQTVLVAALDQAQVATADGCRSLHEWVTGRLDVSAGTAKDMIAICHTAPGLVTDALAGGTMSFDRAVATTRLAAEDVNDAVLDASQGWDIAGVRRLAAKHRRLTPTDEHNLHQQRSLSIQPSLDHHTATLWATLTGPDATTVLDGLLAVADHLPRLPDGTRDSLSRRQADALVALCAHALAGHDDQTDSGVAADRGPALLVTTDLDDFLTSTGQVGAEVVGGLRVGLQHLEEIFCNGTINLNLRLTDGRILAIDGHQPIPPRTRQQVLARDGACTAAGCRSRHRLQVHHIIPRSQGGTHHLSNLTTLCWYHHHVVVHGRGYSIDPNSPAHRRRFLRPNTGTDPP